MRIEPTPTGPGSATTSETTEVGRLDLARCDNARQGSYKGEYPGRRGREMRWFEAPHPVGTTSNKVYLNLASCQQVGYIRWQQPPHSG